MRSLPSFANFRELQEMVCRHQIEGHESEAFRSTASVYSEKDFIGTDLIRCVSSDLRTHTYYENEDPKGKYSDCVTLLGSPKSVLSQIDNRDECEPKKKFSLGLPSFCSAPKKDWQFHFDGNDATNRKESELERNSPRGFRFFLPSERKWCPRQYSDDGADVKTNIKDDLDEFRHCIESYDSQEDDERDDQLLSLPFYHFDPHKLVFTSNPQDLPEFTPTRNIMPRKFLPSELDAAYSYAFETSATMKKDDEWGQFADLSSDAEDVLDRKSFFTYAFLTEKLA